MLSKSQNKAKLIGQLSNLALDMTSRGDADWSTDSFVGDTTSALSFWYLFIAALMCFAIC